MITNVNSLETNCFCNLPPEIKIKILTVFYRICTYPSDLMRSCGLTCKCLRDCAFEVIRLQGRKRILRCYPLASRKSQEPLTSPFFSKISPIDSIKFCYVFENYKEEDLVTFLSLKNFANIRTISLEYGIKTTLPLRIVQSLAQLPKLQKLKFDQLDPEISSLSRVTGLKVLKVVNSLTIRQNVLKTAEQIATLRQLEKLSIPPFRQEYLCNRSCELLANLPNLTSLDAGFEAFESVTLFTGLKVLHLYKVPPFLAELAQLPKLHTINSLTYDEQFELFFEKDEKTKKFKYEHLFFLKNKHENKRENYFLHICKTILTSQDNPERKNSLRNILLQQTYLPREILIGLLNIACSLQDEALLVAHLISLDKTIINEKNQEGETPLLTVLSARNVREALLILLLDNDADPNLPGNAKYKETDIKQILPLQFVIYAELYHFIDPLLNAGADCLLGLYNPLLLRCANFGPKCSTFPPYSLVLSKSGTFNYFKNMLLSDPRIAKKQDEEKKSVLHWVCENGGEREKDFFELLLKQGAEVNALDEKGNSPLYYLLMNRYLLPYPGRQFFKVLVTANAKVIVNGETIAWKNLDTVGFPATWLQDFIRSVQLDIKPGLLAFCSTGNLILFLKCSSHSINLSEYANLRNEEGETLLHLAVRNKDKETISLLIEAGADLKAVNKNLETPFNLAVSLGFGEICLLLGKVITTQQMEKRKKKIQLEK